MSDELTSLQALAEIRRIQVIAAKMSPATSKLFTDAYAFAISRSVCPYLDEDWQPGAAVFNAAYSVKREAVMELAELLDAKWLAKEQITFYDLESPSREWDRMELFYCLRYFFIRGMFDADFWKGVLSNAPVEAHGMTKPFSTDELL